MNKEIERCFQNAVPMYRHKIKTEIFILKVICLTHNKMYRLTTAVALLGTFNGKFHKNVLCPQMKDALVKPYANQVRVTHSDQSGCFGKKIYKGWVHHVDGEQVHLKLSKE